MTDYMDIITLEPGKRSGKPCIRRMRITVDDVLAYPGCVDILSQLHLTLNRLSQGEGL